MRTPLTLANLNHRADARGFWRKVTSHGAGARLVPDADARELLVLSGWALEVRRARAPGWSTTSLILPGDIINLGLGDVERVEALTVLEVVDCRVLLGRRGDDVEAEASLLATLARQDERVFDHIMRLGQLTGRERVLHLLLELHDRLQRVGRTHDDSFRVPITRELMADLLGLSVAHLKRVLGQLHREGLIAVGRGAVALPERAKLAQIAHYQPAEACQELAA